MTDVPALRRAAMDFLARREHSFLELRQKLQRKYPAASAYDLEAVLCQLRDEGLQSDERFVENYIRYRKSRGFGYLHIRQDLMQRGVEESLIEAYLFEDDDWDDLVCALLAKKTGGEPVAFGSKAHRRLLRFLESRGFPASLIRKHLDRLLTSGNSLQ